jgi:hypothetical protein
MVELSQEINIMNGFVLRPDNIPPRILDTRGPADNFDAYKVKAGTTFTVPVPGGAGKTCAIVNLASVHTEGQGFLTAWASGDKPNSSEMNPVPTSAVANEVTIPLAADGSFKLFSNVRTHIFIDLKGYYQPL